MFVSLLLVGFVRSLQQFLTAAASKLIVRLSSLTVIIIIIFLHGKNCNKETETKNRARTINRSFTLEEKIDLAVLSWTSHERRCETRFVLQNQRRKG